MDDRWVEQAALNYMTDELHELKKELGELRSKFELVVE